ncbi:13292_t:CDS:2 [Ambispora gerdemannii]|uniref:13292_t:CDS:1 n=1 Tax=Ambispora gerdemannii TaxID=144530 RepID=A0A9N9A8L8_9GLOM|nr:13292_t:CDS:2 [Ambispora gerdemannii]
MSYVDGYDAATTNSAEKTKKDLKQKDIAAEYGISKQSVSDIVKAKEQWVKIESGTTLANSKRARRATYDARSDLDLSDSLLMEKALIFAKEFEVSDKFLASFREKLQDIIKDYEPQDVFNCDETALY